MTDNSNKAAEPTSPKARAKAAPAPVIGLAANLDTSGPAEIEAAAEFSPSGAPRQVTDIDVSHPAVDNDPRAGTTLDQNRIDFNDPSINGADSVTKNLEAQAKG